MKKAKSSSISTLTVEKPQSELKDSSKSDDKLERLLKQIALLPCPEETGGMETEGHKMGGPPSADTVLKLVARGYFGYRSWRRNQVAGPEWNPNRMSWKKRDLMVHSPAQTIAGVVEWMGN